MGFIVPIMMCLAFIFVWVCLTKGLLALNQRLMKKSLLRSKRLDMKSMAALISLYFGEKTGKIFLYGRWFPKRSPKGTVYESIPCILLFGKKMFVLEICHLPGLLQNTDRETWSVTPPAEYTKKKEIQIKNPLLQAKERADLLTELLGTVKCPFEISVEPMVVFTDKEHKLALPGQKGMYTVKEALAFLAGFAPKTKTECVRVKRANKIIFGIFGRYSLSQRQAIAKNNKIRTKKK